jgi:hypothetical protein
MWHPAIAEQLRIRGVEARAVVRDPELAGYEDWELFEFAQRDEWTIVTENAPDFIRLAHQTLASGGIHFGLVFTKDLRFPRASERTIGKMVRALEAFAARTELERSFERWLTPPDD